VTDRYILHVFIPLFLLLLNLIFILFYSFLFYFIFISSFNFNFIAFVCFFSDLISYDLFLFYCLFLLFSAPVCKAGVHDNTLLKELIINSDTRKPTRDVEHFSPITDTVSCTG